MMTAAIRKNVTNSFYLLNLLRVKNASVMKEEERCRKAQWRQKMRETNPDYITKIKEYNRERKRKARASIKTSAHSLCSSPSTPVKKSNPPMYYKLLNKSKKVQEILGPSPITHTSVLKHVLKKVMRSPRKSECFKSSPFKKLHNSSFVTPPKDASVTKDLRKIAVLRSK